MFFNPLTDYGVVFDFATLPKDNSPSLFLPQQYKYDYELVS